MFNERVVGREADLRVLNGFLAIPGPRAFLMEGDAGIGKTTLGRAIATEARERGMRVLVARPGEAEQELTLSTLSALIDDAVLAEVSPRLAEPRRRVLEAALLLREERDGPGDLMALGLALLAAVQSLAAGRPLLILVDDLHWVDQTTLVMLDFALRRLQEDPVHVLCTIRTDRLPSGWPQPLLGFAEERRMRIRVGPLSVGALGRIIDAQIGVSFPRRLLLRIHEASGGNPFLALEIARSIHTRGMDPVAADTLPVTPDVEALVADRLTHLPDSAREALLVASAASRPTMELIEAVLGEAPGRQAVDEAIAAGVLVAEGEAVRPAHPLLASVVYGRTTAGRRRTLHARLAALVSEPEERARQLALGADGPDAGVAAALDDAARLAHSRGASTAAAGLADLAVRLTPPGAQDDLRRRQFLAAEHLRASGETERARSLAGDLLNRLQPGRERVPILLLLGRVEIDALNHNRAAAWGEQALAEAGDDRLLQARSHGLLSMARQRQEALRHAEAAFDLLKGNEDADPVVVVNASVAKVLWTFFEGEGFRRDLLQRAVELEERLGPASIPLSESAVLTMAQLVGKSGDEDANAFYTQRLFERIDAGGEEAARANAYAHDVGRLRQIGDITGAIAAAEQRLSLVREYGQNEAAAVISRAQIDAYLGTVAEARDLSTSALADAEARGDPVDCARNETVLGFVDLSLGHMREAAGHYIHALELCDQVGLLEPIWFMYHGDLIESLIGADQVDEADRIAEVFERGARHTGYPWSLAVSGRSRALVHAARGDLDRALASLEEALVVHERLLNPFEKARTLLAIGHVQRRAGQRRAARESLNTSLAIMEQLGFPLWAGKVQAEIGRLGGRVALGPTDLTEAERNVAELAAAGRSNKEIAAELILSVRTVESHLSTAYRKLGVRSRTQLAGALAAERR